ncbi:MAG TPA: penicillin-binding transpeptidase domain-containing protein [Nocardioides sp.]|nr:penicillin-binding transpeptidase domain-containing protein [Nocardioides sp.]
MIRRTRRHLPVVLSLAVAASLVSCTGDDGPQPGEAADTVVALLERGEAGRVPWVEAPPRPQQWWQELTGDLGVRPDVEVDEVVEAESGDEATARLTWSWPLREGEPPWQHQGTLRLERAGEGETARWEARAEPTILDLRRGERLDVRREPPPRAPILGAGGTEIVVDRPVLRFGVDKTRLPRSEQAGVARRLAAALDVDAGSLVQRVRDAGDRAFVEAIVLRREEAGPALRAIAGLDGAAAVEDTLPLAPTREFARPLLGIVGPVTAEVVEESDGFYRAGDEAGLSGLQQRYDEQLRGVPGLSVLAIRGKQERELFHVEPQPGDPLRTTLDLDLQASAERLLAGVGPAAALVALRPSTGDLLAVASGPGGGGYSTATLGQYAPGSTFKIVSSLALLRAGLDPISPVDCPASVVVDGKRFENYDDYPPSGLGRIPLRSAVANSCNTAFIGQRDRVGSLGEAAAALGLGVDHDLGFPVYLGSVPEPESETSGAAALIGQGQVLASPVAMAAVVGSVARGETVLPRLLPDHDVERTAVPRPLAPAEARALRAMLRAVVTEGSGVALADVPGPPVIAKTGTAEFGTADPPRTHAWLVAAQGDLAVAAFVEQGESGSRTAGPLAEALLRTAR